MLPMQKSLNIWPPAKPQPKSNSYKAGEVILVRGFFWQAPLPLATPFQPHSLQLWAASLTSPPLAAL